MVGMAGRSCASLLARGWVRVGGAGWMRGGFGARWAAPALGARACSTPGTPGSGQTHGSRAAVAQSSMRPSTASWMRSTRTIRQKQPGRPAESKRGETWVAANWVSDLRSMMSTALEALRWRTVR